MSCSFVAPDPTALLLTQRYVVPVPVKRVTGDTRVQPHTTNLVISEGSCAKSPNLILLRIYVSSSGLTVCEAGRLHDFVATVVGGSEDRRACARGSP
jgi:hypothetical protein